MNERGHVLVVDDNQINRMMLSRAVNDLGHTVTTADDGFAALELLRSADAGPFDAVLLDILMPELDGYEILETIKNDEHLQHIPVIMISALDEIDSVVRCIEIGATDYLTKPFKPTLLRARLNASLTEKRLRDLEREYLEQAGKVASAAEAVEAARFDPESLDAVATRNDALGQLARVFQRMAREVYLREQRLKNQLARLHLDMDEMKKAMSEPLSVYIPMDRRQAIANGKELPENSNGAVLDADISGFTPLTTALANDLGLKQGAEEITRYLNQVFGSLVTEVHRFGGSVISFSGDAITCWFEGDEGLRAVACGEAMQDAMKEFSSIRSPSNTEYALTLKVAIVKGPVKRMLVGDPNIQVVDVLAGQTLSLLGVGDHLVESGEILVSSDIAESVTDQASVIKWRKSDKGERFAVLGPIRDQIEPNPWPPIPSDAISEDQCRPWLPRSVFERIQGDSRQFLADLRPAAALFINFAGIDYDNDPEAASKLDKYVQWVQTVLDRYEGNLIQLTIGDKGSYIFAAFGAPVSHNDDAMRAVYAGLALQSPPPDLGFITGVFIGVTMGQMRTGAYGSTDRRTYGVMGDKVNLAARLMQAASAGVLCDEEIYNAANSRLVFDVLEPIQVKGKKEKLAVYHPTGERRRSDRVRANMIGRMNERVKLRQAVETFLRGEGGVLFMEGEAGIGKSRLMQEVEQQIKLMKINGFHVSGNLAERSSPFVALREFLVEVLGAENVNLEFIVPRIDEMLADDPDLAALAPLAGKLLGFRVEDNPVTQELHNNKRVEKTRELLLGLYKNALSQPAIILIDNAQDLDDESWRIIASLSQHNSNCLFIFASRPLPDTLPPVFVQIQRHPRFEHMLIKALNGEEVFMLVCEHLGVVGLPEIMMEKVVKTSGNPLLIEEMIYSLKDDGFMRVTDGVCELDPDTDWDHITLPNTVQGVLITRIDQLSPSEQLVLKVASIIGKQFERKELTAIFPVQADIPHIENHLETLAQLELIQHNPGSGGYVFKNSLVYDLAYNSLLYSQRRQLHRMAAEWYEATNSHKSPAILGVLGNHWRYADEPAKATEYFESAGKLSADNGDLKSAEYYYQQSLEVMSNSAVLSHEYHSDEK